MQPSITQRGDSVKKIIFFVTSKTKTVNESGEVVMVDSLTGVEMPYSEKTLAIAQEQSYNGEFTIEDDGQYASESTDDVLNALLGVTV